MDEQLNRFSINPNLFATRKKVIKFKKGTKILYLLNIMEQGLSTNPAGHYQEKWMFGLFGLQEEIGVLMFKH